MPNDDGAPLLPSEVSTRVGFFDRFAGRAALLASRAPFFAFCVLLVLVWMVQGVITLIATHDFHKLIDSNYQLEINTTTTIITFLMVALLQNSQTRDGQAMQHKLNAIADGLADLMDHLAERGDGELRQDIEELRTAVGLEEQESTTKNRAQGGSKSTGAATKSGPAKTNGSTKKNGAAKKAGGARKKAAAR